MNNKKRVELPLVEPIYSSYNDGIITAIYVDNPSIRNFYLNEVMILECNRKFLRGYTSPEIFVLGSGMHENPYLIKKWYVIKYLKGHINYAIRNLIDDGYYVFFSGIDDYYIEGKSWYKERHAMHTGTIVGYDQNDKTYCMYAYDSNWVYQKFWTSQKCFNAGRISAEKEGVENAEIYGLRASDEIVAFCPEKACAKIAEYLDSSVEKYPENEDGPVHGIAAQEYLAKYIDKLYDGSIPYERKDRRILRLIWEHKKNMHERIICIESAYGLSPDISKEYETVVNDANTIRMMYASYTLSRKDYVLPIIKRKLLALHNRERELLESLLKKVGY